MATGLPVIEDTVKTSDMENSRGFGANAAAQFNRSGDRFCERPRFGSCGDFEIFYFSLVIAGIAAGRAIVVPKMAAVWRLVGIGAVTCEANPNGGCNVDLFFAAAFRTAHIETVGHGVISLRWFLG
jgi:hypothetical protein